MGTSSFRPAWPRGPAPRRRCPRISTLDGRYIRTGFRWRIDVAWTTVAAFRRATPRDKLLPGYLNVAAYGEPRWVLQLKAPATVYGLFGIRKQVSHVGLTVDDEALFQAELNRRLGD